MAVTEMFKRIEEYRRQTGRDPLTGYKKHVCAKQSDDAWLIVVALRMAARHTTRNDLRPEYLRLAAEIQTLRTEAESCQN